MVVMPLSKKIDSGVVILDANSLVVKYANDHFADLTEYQKEEIIDEKITILNGTLAEKKDFEELEEVLKAGVPVKRRLFHYRKSGSGFWGDITAIPFCG